jgi:hypothetical protein
VTGLAKLLILFGLILVGAGLLLLFAGKIPFLGRLPGDFVIQRPGFTLYLPLGTSVLLSVLLSLVLWLLNR